MFGVWENVIGVGGEVWKGCWGEGSGCWGGGSGCWVGVGKRGGGGAGKCGKKDGVTI